MKEKNHSAEEKQRNWGIDLLRILSMYMIVVLHVLGNGGVLSNTVLMSEQNKAAWLLEIAAYCAVNCYALISGYVGVYSGFHYKRIGKVWMHTVYYTILITAVFQVFAPSIVTSEHWFRAFLPVLTNQYWYITSYVGMFFMIPFMNAAIIKLEEKELRNWLIASFFLFSVGPSILQMDPFRLGVGYSMIWLCMLYLVGAYIKKYRIEEKIKGRWMLLLYFVMVGITWKSRYLLLSLEEPLPFLSNSANGKMFIQYTSPTIVLSGLGLFLCCAGSRISARWIKRVIAFFAPATLGVYIIHVHPLIWEYLVKGFAAPLAEFEAGALFSSVLLTALIVYLLCSLIDQLRITILKLIKSLYLKKKRYTVRQKL